PAATSPSKITELTPLELAQELGYLVVLENIDPQDWARPGADIILQRVKQQRRDGSIILLHDAGGDREQTVEALPRILDYLKTRGDSVVSISTLLGTTRDSLMPSTDTKPHTLTHFVSGAGIAVFLDADTHCQRDTLRRLVEPFSDETIAGVSGHAKVGNLRTFIARCQALEYTCGFNLDRRAYTGWNCMTVVPGAISAIRK